MLDVTVVDVFNNNKLQSSERFNETRYVLIKLKKFISSQLAVGNTCIMSKFENGRPWCVIKYEPQS